MCGVACRSSAAFRPEAVEEFEDIFCHAVEDCSGKALEQIKAHREGREAAFVFRELQQIFGDVFIYAGYLLGHVHGLEMSLSKHLSSQPNEVLQQPKMATLVLRLERLLQKLWLTEFAWNSIDVFAPIYDLICEMMAQHGMMFVRHGDGWKIVLYDDQAAFDAAREAVSRWNENPD